jgi:hypothetical protein
MGDDNGQVGDEGVRDRLGDLLRTELTPAMLRNLAQRAEGLAADVEIAQYGVETVEHLLVVPQQALFKLRLLSAAEDLAEASSRLTLAAADLARAQANRNPGPDQD